MPIRTIIMSLRALRLGGMADALEQQFAGPAWRDAAFEERLEHLIAEEIRLRSQRKVDRIRKDARMRHDAQPETLDFSPTRGLEAQVVRSLLRCDWVRSGRTNLLITGLTGTGKTWMACSFGQAAARLELTVGYHRVGQLLEELEISRHDGLRTKKLERLRRLDLLILDDLGLENLTHNALIDLLNILEDRVGRRSTIGAAQMPIGKWHAYLGGDATADAIMDRLVHTSERLELKGGSLRAKAREASATELSDI